MVLFLDANVVLDYYQEHFEQAQCILEYYATPVAEMIDIINN